MEFNFSFILVILTLIILVRADIPFNHKLSLSNEKSTLPKCVTHSLSPSFKENCSKKGGTVTETHSLAICSKKKTCQCPYFTCSVGGSNKLKRNSIHISLNKNKIIPKSSVKSVINVSTEVKLNKKRAVKTTPNIEKNKRDASLSQCLTSSLPPNFNEDCTKEGGKVTETFSMGLCKDNKTCQCSYKTCAKKSVSKHGNKSKRSKVNNATMEATIPSKETKPKPTVEAESSKVCAKRWEQCDGTKFTGPKCCQDGLKCRKISKYYSLCMK